MLLVVVLLAGFLRGSVREVEVLVVEVLVAVVLMVVVLVAFRRRRHNSDDRVRLEHGAVGLPQDLVPPSRLLAAATEALGP